MNKKIFISLLAFFFLTQCTFLQPNSQTRYKNANVALVLGGGGSKGYAHLGAIEVLEENNIPINLIVGSSAGSAVGAFYADTKNIQKTKDILFKAKSNELLDFSLTNSLNLFSFTAGNSYENFITKNLTAKTFNELKIPLVVVTVDAVEGKKFIIKDGLIAPAVRASSAIPPIMPPVSFDKKTLFDGGIIEPVPVETAKTFNPKLIIAIDINNLPPKTKPNNMIELTYRAFWLSYYQLSRMQAAQADIDIHPDLNGHGTFDDTKKEELYQLGRQAALKALPQIKQKLLKLE